MQPRRSAPPVPGPPATIASTYADVSELEKYKLVSNIGKGSFGVISKVQRIEDGKEFALKQLDYAKMTDKDRKQILAEVAILESLKHRNIVQMIQKIKDPKNERIYIVMEYCTSGDLGSLIRKAQRSNTPLNEDKIWNIFLQIVMALHHCHWPNERSQNGASGSSGGKAGSATREDKVARCQVLHRDLKPENVFLSEDLVKLGDFGLSKDMGTSLFTATYVGTPLYMPPEILAENKYDTKSDIWSLGCLVYEMCALVSPFSTAQTQAELITMVRSGRIPPIPQQYSPALRNVIKAMLSLVPMKRPTTQTLLDLDEMKLHRKLYTMQTQSLMLASRQDQVRRGEEALQLRLSQFEEREAMLVAREAALFDREEACRSRETVAAETEQRLVVAAEALRAQWEKVREERAGMAGTSTIHEQLDIRRPSMPPVRPSLEERATLPLLSAARPARVYHQHSYDDTPSKIPVPAYANPAHPALRQPGSLRRNASKSLGNLAARAQAEAVGKGSSWADAAPRGRDVNVEATPAKQVIGGFGHGHRPGRSSISSPDDLKKKESSYHQAPIPNANQYYWTEDVSMASPATTVGSPFVPLAPGAGGIMPSDRRRSIPRPPFSFGFGVRPLVSTTSSQESISSASGSGDSGPDLQALALASGSGGPSSNASSSSQQTSLPTPAKWSMEDPDLPSPFLRRMPTAPPAFLSGGGGGGLAPSASARERAPLGLINPQPSASGSGSAGPIAPKKPGMSTVPMPRSRSGNLHQHVLKQNAAHSQADKRSAGTAGPAGTDTGFVRGQSSRPGVVGR